MKTFALVLVLLLAAQRQARAQSSTPLCALPGTPTIAQIDATLVTLAQNASYTDNTTVTVDFSGGDLRATDGAGTVCSTGLLGNTLTCKIEINPKDENAVSAPILWSHELYHASCEENDCPLNLGVVNATAFTNVIYQSSPTNPFNASEIYTHYHDYFGFKSATENAIDNGDQATATYAANWAYLALFQYNQMYSNTLQTLGLLNSALVTYQADAQLASAGTSTDGNLSVTFATFLLSSSTVAGTSMRVGQPGVQLTLKDPDAPNGVISAQYLLTDSSLSGGLMSSPNFPGALTFLQQQIDSTTAYLTSLPVELPPHDVYDEMVTAGYAPPNSFDASNLLSNFLTYDPATGAPAMLPADPAIVNAALVPPAGVGATPDCSGLPPYEAAGTAPDDGGTGPVGQDGGDGGAATGTLTFNNFPSCQIAYSQPEQSGSSACSDSSLILVPPSAAGNGWMSLSFDVKPTQSASNDLIWVELDLSIPDGGVVAGATYAVMDDGTNADGGAIDVSSDCNVTSESDGLDSALWPANGWPWAGSGSTLSVQFTAFDPGNQVFHGTVTGAGACESGAADADGNIIYTPAGVVSSVYVTF